MIVVGGEALIDMIMTLDGRFTPVVGGGPYNTARTLARLGHDVRFLGRISDDAFGRRMHDQLEHDGVGTGLVVRTTDPSTLVLAEIDAHGTATYRFYVAGTSAPGLTIDAARRALHPAPDALHVGTLGLALEPIAASLAALVGELPASTLLMVDPNCRAGVVADMDAYVGRMRRLLARADIVKVSGEDLDFLALAASHDAAAEAILAGGARAVLLTSGSDAIRAYWAGGVLDVPVPKVPVVDTIGAGDSFGGGFLGYWLEHGLGRDDLADPDRIERAARFGIEVAAVTVQRVGADPPTRDEVGPIL